ncbi:MAG: glycosyltransferase family 4 protein [Verrucomicrobia bacterium]|jgi:glycosyltransferase involved in cell wall biosynthesis|nr:glycosyltransferase family 4 protein [Verrucomicrobiota bacterium]MBT7066313.1 glycosyltransferase family 4 protein [Verrucomicrobiota bacterium]MBT7699271.1 glycosyltransferase family 4 protein [Verrucomicrobiota bacterium]
MKCAVSLLNYRPGSVGGIETYIRKLSEIYAADPSGHEITFIAGAHVADQLPTGARRQLVPHAPPTLIAGRCMEAFTPLRAARLARQIDAAGYDVILFPQQSIFPIGIQTPAVLTVVDVQHLHRPEHYPLFDTCFRRTIYPRSLARAQRIIAISQVTQRDLVELCNVAAEKIEVVHLGFDRTPPPPADERLVERPYLYYPAATFAHKGHADLLRCFARLKVRHAHDITLVFSGMQTALWRQLKKQIAALGLQRDVAHLGFVDYEDIPSLYQHAEAVVFPSQFEGFGMPVLEAVRYRKPIFCSDLPIFDELGVPAANRIDFTDPDALIGIMQRLQPTALLKEPISWDECAKKTLQVMAKTVESAGKGI